uniref:Sm-ribonuclease n=1 Tax=Citrus sinensis TaxID=2711 RepID=A0A6B9KM45_CITSI|nr:Sm-ribonuclease [Citrus sinensis]
MKINFCIFIVLFVYCISSVENNSGFDHFWLVLSWPPVYCLQIRCERKPTDFVLHGLWPVNSTGHSLKNSTNGTPNFYSMLRNHSFGIEMDEHWPSLGSKEGRDPYKHIRFWEHEWEEHGSGQPYGDTYYLQSAIRLRKSVNLLRILRIKEYFQMEGVTGKLGTWMQ